MKGSDAVKNYTEKKWMEMRLFDKIKKWINGSAL